jgi:hypothetical protein
MAGMVIEWRKWWNCGMAEWRNGGMAGMAVQRKEWQNGRMAEMATYVLFTVHTHRRHRRRRNLIFYSIETQKMPQKDIGLHLIEDTKVLRKNGKLIIPTSLRHRAVTWYHHYLQHPGHSRLEEMMRSVMYWKGMPTTIRRYIKTCQSCQVNKRHSQKYGHLPP